MNPFEQWWCSIVILFKLPEDMHGMPQLMAMKDVKHDWYDWYDVASVFVTLG